MNKMNDTLNKVAAHMSLEFMRDNLEKIRHCVVTGQPIIIKDGELVDPDDFYKNPEEVEISSSEMNNDLLHDLPLVRVDAGPYKYEPTTTLPPYSFKKPSETITAIEIKRRHKEYWDKADKRIEDALHKLKTGGQHD